MLKAAQFYAANGYSVIATDNTKRSILSWKKYQHDIATLPELNEQFTHHKCTGIAVIAGQVSGNLEVIDVDTKYDLTGKLWEEFKAEIKDIFPRLYCVKTKSGGYHLYYKCEIIEGNQKLARRPASEQELKDNPNVKEIVLIETRGEGGYVIAPPTEGYTKENEFNVPVITSDEREMILTAARSFDQITEEVKPEPRAIQHATSYQKTPWDDYNEKADVIALLEKHGWSFVQKRGPRSLMKRPGDTNQKSSGDYHHELNLFKVFSSSTQFDLNKGYKPFAIYTVLEHGGDYSKAAKQLIKDGYGESGVVGKVAGKVIRSLGMGHTKQQISQVLITEDGLSKKDAERIIDDVESQNGPEILTFWEVQHTRSKKIINILRHKLVQFLFDNGFHLFFYNKHSGIYRIVQQKGGFIQDATFETIKKYVKDYIASLPDKFDSITPAELMEVVMKGADTYFGKGLIEFLDAKDIDILRDTHDAAYFTFRNSIIKVTADKIEKVSYGSINKPVWKSQVIDFDVDIDNEFDPNLCEFFDFTMQVSGGADNEYLCSLIGYLLHRYKDPSRPFAVILAEETEDEKKGGGTGKGILVKALSYMANMERVDGKNFKLDKAFAFQRVGLDTKIVAIEDVRKNMDFEGFYPIITEGMTIEQKNKAEFFINFADAPKIIFTTNYTVANNAGHGKRRQRLFEFSNFFGTKHTPLDRYKHKLFDDWDNDEWNRFYNFMFLCVQDYLLNGVRSVENSVSMKRKHIRLNYTPEFMDWWDGYIANGAAEFKAFRDMYSAYLVQNNFERKDYSQKRFRAALEEACEKFDYQIDTKREGYERILQYRIIKN